MTTDTKVQAVNIYGTAHAEYKEYALRYIGEYMTRIGVQQWSIDKWQSVIWYDGQIRIIPYKWNLTSKNRFVFDLAGGFRPCCEYMFMHLDRNGITYKGIQL